MFIFCTQFNKYIVTSREGRVSRNIYNLTDFPIKNVTSREGRVSRNAVVLQYKSITCVTSREGRVSRNSNYYGRRNRENLSRPARDV